MELLLYGLVIALTQIIPAAGHICLFVTLYVFCIFYLTASEWRNGWVLFKMGKVGHTIYFAIFLFFTLASLTLARESGFLNYQTAQQLSPLFSGILWVLYSISFPLIIASRGSTLQNFWLRFFLASIMSNIWTIYVSEFEYAIYANTLFLFSFAIQLNKIIYPSKVTLKIKDEGENLESSLHRLFRVWTEFLQLKFGSLVTSPLLKILKKHSRQGLSEEEAIAKFVTPLIESVGRARALESLKQAAQFLDEESRILVGQKFSS